MKNTNDCNKNRDDASSPEQKKIVAKAKNKSKHRINYFEWTILLIREMFRLQINMIALKLKEISAAASQKSSIIKKLKFQIRKSELFLKKKTKGKYRVLLLETLLFFSFSQIHCILIPFQKSRITVAKLITTIRNIDIQGSCPQFIKRNHAIFFFRLKLRCVTDNVKCFVSFKMGRV